jgi:putative transposase
MIATDLKYKRFWFPIAVISQAVYLYNRFTLSYRDVSDLLLEPRIAVSHQTVKKWNVRFGAMFASEIKNRRRKPTRRWHIDETHCKIAGKRHYIWRAVDSDGTVLDIFVPDKSNKKAAKEFFSKLYDQYDEPSRITTDRLRLYRSVVPETFSNTKHIKGKWLNNRVENSHIIIREREKKFKRFKSREQAQTFLDRFEFIRSYLKPKQHLMPPSDYRNSVKYRLRIWDEIAEIPLH